MGYAARLLPQWFRERYCQTTYIVQTGLDYNQVQLNFIHVYYMYMEY